MSSEWRRLCLSQENLPPLLCQYTWTRQGYELYLTDLTTIWSERLSRKEILKRADDSATTIDPSEDLDQLDLLLTKIGEALRGDGGSNTTLNSGASSDSLQLNTSTELPAPLRPLKWSILLSREPAFSTTSHLILPLLRGEASLESRQRNLLDQLKQKDWVLSKLFDRFEALGADLGTVFPGVAGLRTARKGSSRSEAAKFIKGVAPFDEQSWLAESESISSSSAIVSNLIHELAGSGNGLDLDKLHPSQEKWWSGLQRRTEAVSFQEEEPKKLSQSRTKPIESKGDVDPGEETASESDVDEFEVCPKQCPSISSIRVPNLTEFQQQEVVPRQKPQETQPVISPSKPKARKKTPSPSPKAVHTNEASATESEHEPEPEPELSPPPRRKRTSTPPPSAAPVAQDTPPTEIPNKPKKGLGMIGGKKKIPEPEPERAPLPPPEPTRVQIEDHAQSTAPATKAKKPTRLGMIGGKAKTKQAPLPETPSVQQEEPLPSSPNQKTREKPPAPKHDRVSPKRESLEPSLPAKAPSAVPAPEETEAQRADRKREELKRQLEAKSKAPAKKKRRF
ncbi:hypothetical protein PENSUB_13140 [Penicillium subrubescens]|uniref:Non-homologous end-joining factor 1 n=1 Tax=Penicillium subrubescens TaxID=1316194 RepID=A0A1Q5SS68_9EURO|nr:hypothetical protein PENSUB_13140 [Penicillium subrubescens]